MKRGKTKRNKLTKRELDIVRLLVQGKNRNGVANELGLSPNTVWAHQRNIRIKLGLASARDIADYAVKRGLLSSPAVLELPEEKPLPVSQEFYNVLKGGPVSLRELSQRYDRSEETILQLIDKMEQAGYVIERIEQTGTFNASTMPTRKPQIGEPLLDEAEYVIKFGVVSDIHSGSTCSQPTNLNKFIKLAVDEGVQHILVPGDVTAGLFGYRGQEYDLVPCARPVSRKEAGRATLAQVWLADSYLPKYPNLQYYLLGGNHDYWHISKVGIDAVSLVARERGDMYYLGYDVADVPLTNQISARLFHPTGGVAYALSYKLQKNIEQTAFEQLVKLVEQELPPTIRFILAGHLHVEVKFQSGPIIASQVGCFEGQTNYLKRKSLFPAIGGQIWTITLTDSGRIHRVKYEFIPYSEIENDWRNWPQPPDVSVIAEPDELEVIFNLVE